MTNSKPWAVQYAREWEQAAARKAYYGKHNEKLRQCEALVRETREPAARLTDPVEA